MTQGFRPVPRLFTEARQDGETSAEGERRLPEERAVALSFNGTTQAVMMATPDDLVDFAYGFALTEGIALPHEIEEVSVVSAGRGTDVQCWLVAEAEDRLKDRRRSMAGPVGCGLCGIDSIDQALRALPAVADEGFTMRASEVLAAIAALPAHQPLHDLTRAAHCAAYWAGGAEGGAILAAREDVGRHNALDKLAGHLIRKGRPPGAVLLTSRVSTDMVQKVATIGATVLIAVSAPTADAVSLADQLGITLVALARGDKFELFTHRQRILLSA